VAERPARRPRRSDPPGKVGRETESRKYQTLERQNRQTKTSFTLESRFRARCQGTRRSCALAAHPSGNFPSFSEEVIKWKGSPPANELGCGYFVPPAHVYNDKKDC
jgi:hypothetical protein